MKIIAGLGAACAARALSSAAFAGEMADQCVAALEAEGRDTSGCACLEEKVTASPALVEEFNTLGEIEDPTERFEAASPEAQAVMTACTRKE